MRSRFFNILGEINLRDVDNTYILGQSASKSSKNSQSNQTNIGSSEMAFSLLNNSQSASRIQDDEETKISYIETENRPPTLKSSTSQPDVKDDKRPVFQIRPIEVQKGIAENKDKIQKEAR